MVKLIIRDDDCNYFTRPQDLEAVYKDIPEFPVTFAVVPTITDCCGGCPETKGNEVPRYIGDNKELVDYLRKRLRDGTCDVVLHGITHGYKFTETGVKIPEMIWRNDESSLDVVIGSWKTKLETLLNYKLNCFVAPSNRIGRKALQAVYKNNLNFSGIVSIRFNRDLTLRALRNYSKRIYLRAVTKFAYPGLMDYGTHKELNANNHTDYDYLVRLFDYCDKHDYPLAINVHYWHMRENPDHYEGFFKFIKYALAHGAIPTKLSDIFK